MTRPDTRARLFFPSELERLTDAQLRRVAAHTAGLLASRQGDEETAEQYERIAGALRRQRVGGMQ